jgi:hypothetical protein
MLPEIAHLSYSSISTYQLCPKSWYFRYIEKPPVAASPTLLFGSAFHDTIQAAIKARAAGDLFHVADYWPDAWAQRVRDTEGRDQEIAWNGADFDGLLRDGFDMLACDGTEAFLSGFTPMLNSDGQPVIEQEIWLSIPGLPKRIKGFIDARSADGTCYDFKTSSRAWTQQKANEEAQPSFYVAALSQSGEMPFAAGQPRVFRHVVWQKPSGRARKVQVQVIESARTGRDVFALFRNVAEVWKGIEAESFPCSTGTWKCNPKYCDYFGRCQGKV